jgi:HlyD family secretion protein
MNMPVSRRRRRRWPWIFLALLLLGGVGFVVANANKNDRRGQTLTLDDLDLRVGKAEVSDIQVTVAEVGTIEPTVKVDVKSTLSGKVTDLLVREGDRVRRGQVLAQVEPDVNQAQTLSEVRSELRMAEIRATDAQKDLETNERLHREGYVSDQGLKDIRFKADTASRASTLRRSRCASSRRAASRSAARSRPRSARTSSRPWTAS